MCTTLNRWIIDGRSGWKDGLMDGIIVAHANVLYVSEYKDKLIHRINSIFVR